MQAPPPLRRVLRFMQRPHPHTPHDDARLAGAAERAWLGAHRGVGQRLRRRPRQLRGAHREIPHVESALCCAAAHAWRRRSRELRCSCPSFRTWKAWRALDSGGRRLARCARFVNSASSRVRTSRRAAAALRLLSLLRHVCERARLRPRLICAVSDLCSFASEPRRRERASSTTTTVASQAQRLRRELSAPQSF